MSETCDLQVRTRESVILEILSPVGCVVLRSDALRDVLARWRAHPGQRRSHIATAGTGTGTTPAMSATLPSHRLRWPHATLLAPGTLPKTFLQKHSRDHRLFKDPTLIIKISVRSLIHKSSSVVDRFIRLSLWAVVFKRWRSERVIRRCLLYRRPVWLVL